MTASFFCDRVRTLDGATRQFQPGSCQAYEGGKDGYGDGLTDTFAQLALRASSDEGSLAAAAVAQPVIITYSELCLSPSPWDCTTTRDSKAHARR